MSVLMHTMLIQALCGNVVVAKVPTDGGLYTLSLAVALARRVGLPFTLLSGSGGELSSALIESPDITAVSYVGGKSHGRGISLNLIENRKRYMLEMEGVNPYGIWEFSNWSDLAATNQKRLRIRQTTLHRLSALGDAARIVSRIFWKPTWQR